MVYLDAQRDMQDMPPVGECMRCGDGLSEYESAPDENGHVYCGDCRALLDIREQEERVYGKEPQWN